MIDQWFINKCGEETASERGTRSRLCPRRTVRLCKCALQGRWGAFHGSRPKQRSDCSTHRAVQLYRRPGFHGSQICERSSHGLSLRFGASRGSVKFWTNPLFAANLAANLFSANQRFGCNWPCNLADVTVSTHTQTADSARQNQPAPPLRGSCRRWPNTSRPASRCSARCGRREHARSL